MATPTEVLLAMEEYEGTSEAFKRESATLIRGEIGCSEEEAMAILDDLERRCVINSESTRGGALAGPIRKATWRWIAGPRRR